MNGGDEANRVVLPESIYPDWRDQVGEEEANRSSRIASEAGPSTNRIRSSVMMIPADKAGYVIGTNGTTVRTIERFSKARVEVRGSIVRIIGTQNQIEDAKRRIEDLLSRCQSRRYQPEHAGVRPDLLPDLACYASSSTLARALGGRPPFWPAGSSSLEADLYYQLQPSSPAMNLALGPGSSFPRLSEVGGYHIPPAARHHPEYPYPTHIQNTYPGFHNMGHQSGLRPPFQPGAHLRPPYNISGNYPIHLNTQYQARPRGIMPPPPRLQEPYYTPPPLLDRINPIQSPTVRIRQTH